MPFSFVVGDAFYASKYRGNVSIKNKKNYRRKKPIVLCKEVKI